MRERECDKEIIEERETGRNTQTQRERERERERLGVKVTEK